MPTKKNLSGNKTNIEYKKRRQVTNSQSNIVPDRNEPSLIQIPGDFFPHAKFTNALWFKLTARELVNQNTAGRGGNLTIGKKGTTFKFLAPNSIVDTQQHTWDEYSSIHSRLLQYVISGQIAIDQTTQMFKNLARPFITNDPVTGKSKFNFPTGAQIWEAIKSTPNVNIPKYKQDTPLRYVSSNRRSYQFTFILADGQGGAQVQQAVELLQLYAAPLNVGELGIEFPYIFRVETDPYGLITMNYAALESIMATWMEPYIRGKAQRCELTLGFKDMSPLFRKTITRGGIVNVNTPPEIQEEQQREIERMRRATQQYFEQQRRMKN